MKVQHGNGQSEYGPGVDILLDGDELAVAIEAYLVARGVHYIGPRTITVNGELCDRARVYVDPSGFVIDNGTRLLGRGPSENDQLEPVRMTF